MSPEASEGSRARFRGRQQGNTSAEGRKRTERKVGKEKVGSAASTQTREETHRKGGDDPAGEAMAKSPGTS